jgi:hypothetical protein
MLYLGCSTKKEIRGKTASLPDLPGTWELREAQNGMMPVKQQAPGNGNLFNFTADSFEQYEEGVIVRRGRYSLERDTTASAAVGLELPTGQFNHRIIFEGDTTDKTFIYQRGDSLEMVSGFFPVDAGSRRIFIKTNISRK